MIQKRLTLLFLLFSLLFTGVAFSAFGGLPAISEISGNQRHGTFVWFDLITHDRKQVRTYYEKLFGWEISEAVKGGGYDLITNKGSKIGGIAEITDEKQPAWLGSLSMSNVEKAVDRVTQLGGKILEPAQQVDDRGVMALVEDNTGAAFVLLDTDSRDPVSRPVQIGDWLWTDLFTTDPAAIGDFYKDLAGLQLKTFSGSSKIPVDVLLSNSKARVGVVEIPWKHITPVWLPYVRVEDITATLEQSDQLGGRLFFKFKGGAILLDPTGAAFGVQQISK
jgi:hypothetical protein